MRVGPIEVGPAIVGSVMALAGLLFLAEPFVDPIPIGGMRVPIGVFSFVALAVALDLGAVVFYRRGQRTAALAHGVAGLGWSLLVFGPVIGGTGALWIGIAVVVGGAVFLVVELA